MQIMSDNELDKLFRDKLEAIEVEPSPLLWNSISDKINGQRKSFPLMQIAASGLVAVAIAGFLFFSREEPVKLYGKQQDTQLPAELNSSVSEQKYTEVAVPIIENKQYTKKVESVRKPLLSRASATTSKLIEESPSQKPVLETSVEIERTDAVKPEKVVSILSDAPVLALHTTPDELPGEEQSQTERSGKIKTVADMVNFVVGKVDKRSNKIIEFSKEDGGDVVSGINLGVVQFRSK